MKIIFNTVKYFDKKSRLLCNSVLYTYGIGMHAIIIYLYLYNIHTYIYIYI